MNRRKFCRSALRGASALALLPAQSLLGAARQAVAGDIDAINADGAQATLRQSSVQELADQLHGSLLLPGNSAYELARQVLNPTIDKNPALIVQASVAADVGTAVDFARTNNLIIAVKCGGHSTSGKSTCDGGVMIDLSQFRHVRVDPQDKVAWVSGGSLLGAMDHESMAHNLVTVAGTVSHTGVGGLTTGGGFGRLARRFGLALDNVRGLDIVSADGKLRHADATQNQDLYWGARGAGSNFGVVTSFEFQLHEMQRQVISQNLMFPISRLRDVLEFYAEHASSMPDALSLDLVVSYPPGSANGFVMLSSCYSGPANQAEAVLAVTRQLGKPLRGGIQSVDYVALQRSADNTAPRTTASYLKSGFIPQINQSLVNDIVSGLEPHPQRSTSMIFQQCGGAISRVATAATAFPHRDSAFNMMVTVGWKPRLDGSEHVRYIKGFWAQLQPYSQGFYVNDADEDNASDTNSNYRGNYARLLEIKRRYDPQNLFRLNANINPVG